MIISIHAGLLFAAPITIIHLLLGRHLVELHGQSSRVLGQQLVHTVLLQHLFHDLTIQGIRSMIKVHLCDSAKRVQHGIDILFIGIPRQSINVHTSSKRKLFLCRRCESLATNIQRMILRAFIFGFIVFVLIFIIIVIVVGFISCRVVIGLLRLLFLLLLQFLFTSLLLLWTQYHVDIRRTLQCIVQIARRVTELTHSRQVQHFVDFQIAAFWFFADFLQ
mmetsp:Transcript_16613/g.26349  ORF Transcript_16613/g.26349 Transcript_16613/m.26349 type:complete len:220 (+) Transcript_16613:383-1042(+)